MPSRNRSAKTCELASRAPNDTGCKSFTDFSAITLRLTLHRDCYAPRVRISIAPAGPECPDRDAQTLRHSCRASLSARPPCGRNCPGMGQKKSRRRRRLEVDNREASNRVDRSHSMSMKTVSYTHLRAHETVLDL